MLAAFGPAHGRRWSRPRLVVAIVIIGLLGLVAVSVTTGDASRPSIVLRSISSPPGAVVAGRRVTLTGRLRNRTDGSRVGRIVVRLRDARFRKGGRVVAPSLVKRLRGGRSARFRLAVVIPRTQPARLYRIVVCVRGEGHPSSCRQAERALRVLGSRTGSGSSAPPKGSVYQTIDGFGTSERVFDDPHVFDAKVFDAEGGPPDITAVQRDAVLDALYVELGLTRLRPVQPDATAGPPPVGIEIADDNADPLATDLTRFNFEGRRLDDHADLVARAKARGVRVAWMSPLNREPWMGVAPGTDDVAEYAEWLLAQVRRFSRRGARLDYISVANEPSFSRNAMSGEFIRDVIKSVGPRLRAGGLLVPFVLPDDVRASSGAAKAATVLEDRVARRYVGALATHLYDEPLDELSAMRSLAERYDLPLWMSEFSLGAMGSMRQSGAPAARPLDWALLMHDLLATYDVGAIDYLWGYIGADADESALIKLDHDSASYRGFTRTKVFYYFGQYSRFIRPGALRVQLRSSSDRIRATAYHRGTARTVVAINPGSTAVTTKLTAPDLDGVGRLAQTRTSPTESWATPPAVPVTGTSVTVTIPPQSVTTLRGTKG